MYALGSGHPRLYRFLNTPLELRHGALEDRIAGRSLMHLTWHSTGLSYRCDLLRVAASGRYMPPKHCGLRSFAYQRFYELVFFTQPPMRRMCICITDVFFCFFAFSVRHKNTRQPFSGTAERIFMKLLPNMNRKMEFASLYPNGG